MLAFCGTLTAMKTESVLIYGKHAVKEALTARPDVVRAVYFAEDARDSAFDTLLAKANIRPSVLEGKKMLQAVPQDAVHQGVIATIDAQALMVEYNAFMRDCVVTPDTAFVLLGEVQDPQNVGAVIRSAAAFGIAGILVPEHRQVQVNATVIKVSAGMAFRVPLISIGNVNQTIRDLKDRSFWIYGLDGEAEQSVTEETFDRPSVFVLGNEATGIREKTLEHCDIPIRIPMHARTESLNASASAAIVLYAWSACHPNALK